MSAGGYGCFAEVYDKLTSNIDYDAISAYYDRHIFSVRQKRGILLELGCGTGNVSVRMQSLGYDVIATDISGEMLSVALAKPHDGVQYLCQDMRALDMYGTVDAAICTLDGINHLDGEEDMLSCFKSASLFLEDGGVFLFDVNTLKKHREVLGDNTFVYDTDGVYLVWQNFYEDGRVDMALDIFTEEEDGSYARSGENITETALPLSRIKDLLISADFTDIRIYDFLTENKGGEDCEKVLFSAVRKHR